MRNVANAFARGKQSAKLDRVDSFERDTPVSLQLEQRVAPPIRLSPREAQIVALVADGLPSKDIALRLEISEGTVVTHLRRVFAKFGVSSRAAMVYRYAMMRGERRKEP